MKKRKKKKRGESLRLGQLCVPLSHVVSVARFTPHCSLVAANSSSYTEKQWRSKKKKKAWLSPPWARTHVKQKVDALRANMCCRLSVRCGVAVSPRLCWSTGQKKNETHRFLSSAPILPREILCSDTFRQLLQGFGIVIYTHIRKLQIHNTLWVFTANFVTETSPTNPLRSSYFLPRLGQCKTKCCRFITTDSSTNLAALKAFHLF